MVVFFGTSPRSALFLEKAFQNKLKIDLVVSAPPKPVGKKHILTENPVVFLAKILKLKYITSLEELSFLKPKTNLGLILDFNKIIPGKIINLFEKGIINIHFSRLPEYKGAAPVQYTILNGDREAWITYYLIDEKLDAGPVLAQTSLPLDLTENTEILYRKLIDKLSSEIKKIISDYLSGKITPAKQLQTASFSRKLTTENCKIDWAKSPEEIERLIRAACPEPGAWTEIELGIKNLELRTLRIKILKAHLENNKLILDRVQLEGKNAVTWKQFQQGHSDFRITGFKE